MLSLNKNAAVLLILHKRNKPILFSATQTTCFKHLSFVWGNEIIMNIKKYGLFLSLLSIAQLSFAAIEPVDAEGDSDGKTIVVTATRTSETIDETLAPVTVFTREDIVKSQAKTLTELLAKVPGVQIIQDGSQGSNTSFFIRGTNSDHALVLIDGMRSSSATLGTTDLQYVDLNQVERIEVVRSSRSSLYGADAIGGVVQIFTRKNSSNKKFAPVFTAGGGSHDARGGSLAASGQMNNTEYSVISSYFGTNGFNSTNSTAVTDDDNDEYWNRSQSINLTQNFDSGAKANVIYTYNEGSSDYDNIFSTMPAKAQAPRYDFQLQNILTAFKMPINNVWTSNIQYGNVKNETDSNYFDFTAFDNIKVPINTDRDSVTWQNDVVINNNQLLTLGVDYYNDSVTSSNNYAHNTNENTGYFAQNQFSIGAHDFILSARHDVDNSYGDNDTGNISWGTNFSKELRVTASFGTSFKAPTINALYWPLDIQGPYPSYGYPCTADDSTIYGNCTYITEGNPDIQPEEAKNYEIGLSGDYSTYNWSANIFENDIQNLINWDSTDVVTGVTPNDTKTTTYYPNNISDAKIQGLEMLFGTELIGWQWVATSTFLNPRNDSTGDILPRRAKRTFNLDADREFGNIDIGVSWLLQSSRYNDEDNTAKLAGYGTMNARATYHVTKEIDLQLKVNNIFDKDYVLSQQSGTDFEQDGVNAFATVIYKPDL